MTDGWKPRPEGAGSRGEIGAASRIRALSPREREAAALATQGLTNKEIATELRIAEQSAKNVLTRAFRKLGVRRRVDLLRQFGGYLRTGYVRTH